MSTPQPSYQFLLFFNERLENFSAKKSHGDTASSSLFKTAGTKPASFSSAGTMVGNDDSKARLDKLELPLLIQTLKSSPIFWRSCHPHRTKPQSRKYSILLISSQPNISSKKSPGKTRQILTGFNWKFKIQLIQCTQFAF